MHRLFLERSFEDPLSEDQVIAAARESGWCFEMYRVNWHGSLLASDGRKLVCSFSSADAEAVRQALKKAEVDMTTLWQGTVHEVAEPEEPNVLVERSFTGPASLDEIQAVENSHHWCLEARNVHFVRTCFSTDRRRMLCLYRAPDAQAVRDAQREAEMPVDRVWSFSRIGPEHLAG